MSLTEFDATGKDREPGHTNEEPRLPTRRGDAEASPVLPLDRQFPSLFARVLATHGDERTRRPRHHHRVRSWLRWTLLAACAVLLLAAGALLGTGAWLRHSMRAALPQLDGELHVAGLSGAVTVTRNAQGVPSLQAGNLDDLLFAQGYVTAQDRLWQMDALRRHAAGELAEILGPKMVEHDRTQRILQMRAAAERAVAALPPDQLHQIEAYANGVNAFITQNSDRLPVEFHLLHYKPAPWTPRDTMLVSLVMFQDLTTAFPLKMKREALAAHLPSDLLADLYPVGSWRDRPPSQPPLDLTTPKPAIEEIPLDDTQVKLDRPRLAAPQELVRIADELATSKCDGCRAGSNNWAVAGARSASGFPLVSNDMHLSLAVPDIWYEAALHSAAADGKPALDVTGFTLPGAPFVIVGRNAHVAWGFTNSGADVQDVRIEHTRGTGTEMEFEKPDSTWEKVGHSAEHIRVRGGHDIDLDVLTTTATVGGTTIVTPVISSLYPTEHRILSLAWTAYDPANVSEPFYGANAASDGASLVVAMAGFGGPSQNLVYADDAKHIGYHALGRIPVRGSMERRTRPLVTPTTPATSGPPDEGDNGDASPEARPSGYSRHSASQQQARFMEASFRIARFRRVPRRRRQESVQAAPAPVNDEPIIPAQPEVEYTVGTAISSVPVDALDATQQWAGYIPYNELPSVVDPADGIVATANARITPDNYPYSISADWAPAYRVERIGKLLTARHGLTPTDMLAIENDTHSEWDLLIAQRLAYALDHASAAALGKEAKHLHAAADILRQWDGQMAVDSSAAAIVQAFRNVIWPALLVPQITAHDHLGDKASKEIAALYQWQGQAVALESLLQHTPAHWLPAGFTNWNDMLATVLVQGLKEAHAPSDLSKWRYGAQHSIDIEHPVFSLSPLLNKALDAKTGTGPREISGDGTTIRATGAHFGPSERFTADMGDPEATIANITTGESGNPASEWYLDQFLPWLQGTSFGLPLHAPAAEHTLTLLP